VTKARSVWTITESGRSALKDFEPYQFLTQIDLLYQEWKSSQIDTNTALDKALMVSNDVDKQRLSIHRAGCASDEQMIELDVALRLHLAL
jgi:DNA-binding PadR family transcriptional regulator